MLNGLVNLVYPPKCLLCDKKTGNESLCRECKKLWKPFPHKLTDFNFPTYASIRYNRVAMKMVLLAKEEGNKSAQELLATAIRTSITRLISGSDKEISIVPIPTSFKPYRRRGINPILELASRTCTQMQRNNQEINIAQLLEVRKSLQDQTGLTNLERLRNLAGAFQVKSQIDSDSYESRRLIVIDDVVASGSTLREAVRALKERNLTVIGAASACFTFRY